ncbi:MAG: hypothetical protein HFJ20_05855 [Clostridia bacterium]|nr:hypothetical protein [Clostridia bacterium]
MFKKENLIKLLIGLVILLILGAIMLALVLDPNAGFIKKESNNNIMYSNDATY